MVDPVIHFQIMGRDKEKLQEFYTNVFDWYPSVESPTNYDYIDMQKTQLLNDVNKIVSGGICEDKQAPSGVTIFVKVQSIDETFKKVLEFGGNIISDVSVNKAGVKKALFIDPSANVIGVIEV